MPPKNWKKPENAYKFQGNGLTETEYQIGLERFNTYCSMYHIENYNDFLLLEELVYRETQQNVNQNKVKDVREQVEKAEKEKKAVDNEIKIMRVLRDEMNENLNQILILKERLGFFRDKGQDDPYKYIEIQKKKFAIWENLHQASRTAMCPHCSKMIMFHLRIKDKWDAVKHPYFIDKLLANEVMWSWVRDGKITKAELAEALNVSSDYIEEIEKRLFKK